MSDQQKQLFNTRIVPGRKGSGRLFEEQLVAPDSLVECLKMVTQAQLEEIPANEQGQCFLTGVGVKEPVTVTIESKG